MLIKVALEPSHSAALRAEADTLTALVSVDGELGALLTPYVPALLDIFDWPRARADEADPPPCDPFESLFGARRGDPSSAPPKPSGLQALAFAHADGLATLMHVRDAYPDGVDARDCAWMFRRLLMALGLAHSAGFTHGAVRAEHIVLAPERHGLLLCDWRAARHWTADPTEPGATFEYRQAMWQDITAAARAAAEITASPTLPRRLRAFYEYLGNAPARRTPSAFDLLDEYDALIEELWGKRRFRPFALPDQHRLTPPRKD